MIIKPEPHEENKTELKTILQLWKESDHDYLIVEKRTWTDNYCFLVQSIEGEYARGKSFMVSMQEKSIVYENKMTVRNDFAEYYSLDGVEDPLREIIINLERGIHNC